MRKASWATLALFVAVVGVHGCGGSKSGGGGSSLAGSTSATSSGTTASPGPSSSLTGSGSKPEYIQLQADDDLSATDLVALLDRTVGAPAPSGVAAATALELRTGFFVTAKPSGSNVILRFEAEGGGVRPRETYVEVAISQATGRAFVDLVDTATATAALTQATPGFGSPWNIFLQAESKTGGLLVLDVAGDAQGKFTVSWKVRSPIKPIDQFGKPAAFGPPNEPGVVEKIGGTVHFPIDLPTFKVYVNQAYGYNAPARFTDFALVPHAWLLLTVTGDSANRVVNVHFDAITTSGARLYVCEAPASTDVGNRFFDETVARMQQMLDEEAAAPGSSKRWGTSFYYADQAKGVVDVVVKGSKGAFDIAYAVETPVHAVKP